MKTQLLFCLAMVLLMASCQSKETTSEASDSSASENPLLAKWDTPFGVPPFDKIKSSDYEPAFEAALKMHKKEIQAIIDNEETPTFANTIEAMEASGKALDNVINVFFAVNGANSDETIRATAGKVLPNLSAHSDDISLNADLYEKVKAVYDQKHNIELSPEELVLLEETHKGFLRSGINLSPEAQTRLRAINGKLAELGEQFEQNLLAETNDFFISTTDEANLAGIPASLVASAAKEAESRGVEGWAFTLQRPSINPFLQYSPNRDMRKQLYNGYGMRANNGNANDSKKILSEMASLRVERAQLKGYKHHADYILADNMAENAERTYKLLEQIWVPALKMAKEERAAMQELMNRDGVAGKLEAWDWRYYAEKVKQERYDLDEEELRPYFEFTAVREGVFQLSNKLFGLTFKELTDVPKWHEDQQVFEVLEADGSHLGVVYMDFFIRPSKQGGAWMNELMMQRKFDGEVSAIVTNNFNFPGPTETTPALLSYNEASTLFHEFGHALHGLMSDVKYKSLSGTNVPRDFVEFPSQVMENWMGEPEVLKLFAKHYETGEVIPDELIKKLKAVGTFNQGFSTVEYMASSYLDLAWHTLEDTEMRDADAFEAAAMAEIGMIPEISTRYRSTYFSHIFGGDPGYSSGYYSYIWSEVLDADCFNAFKETSLFDQETAAKYRRLLAQGGTKPGMELYREFRGRDPEIGALLDKRGLR